MAYYDKIYQNDLIRWMLENINLINKLVNNSDLIEVREFGASEVYFYNVHKRAMTIISWSEALYITSEELARHTPKRFNKNIHILTMIENYHIRLNSILDRVLHLINVGFCLGTPEGDVRWGLVYNNESIKRASKIASKLKEIKKFLERRGSLERHFILHRASKPSEELQEISFYEIGVTAYQNRESRRQEDLIDMCYDSHKYQKHKDFKDTHIELIKLLNNLFDEITPYFKGVYQYKLNDTVPRKHEINPLLAITS